MRCVASELGEFIRAGLGRVRRAEVKGYRARLRSGRRRPCGFALAGRGCPLCDADADANGGCQTDGAASLRLSKSLSALFLLAALLFSRMSLRRDTSRRNTVNCNSAGAAAFEQRLGVLAA